MISIRLEPRFFSCSRTRSCAPPPIANMAITAATPMIMPSMVSIERSLLTRRALSATRRTISAFIGPTSGNPSWTSGFDYRCLIQFRKFHLCDARKLLRVADDPAVAKVDDA